MKLPIEPMLAELTTPGSTWPSGFAYEPKWDGVRVIAEVNGSVRLWARSGNSVTDQYPEIAAELMHITAPCILDGEVVVMRDGKSSFQALQNRKQMTPDQRHAAMRYVPFDVLEADGADYMRLPYGLRRQRLLDLTTYGGAKLVVPTVSSDSGEALWRAVEEMGLEGMIAKPLTSLYHPGNRGWWRKYKRLQRANFTILGFTAGEGSRHGLFGALILGSPVVGPMGMLYAGKCGTGFTSRSTEALYRLMMNQVIAEPALNRVELIRAKAHLGPRKPTWIRPDLVAEVEFADRTTDGTPRFPSFKGLAGDGKVALVSKERVVKAEAAAAPPTVIAYDGSGSNVGRPRRGDVYAAPGSSGMRDVLVEESDAGRLYLKCECPGGRFVWKGNVFKPCKHMTYVLQNQLAGNTLVDGHFSRE